MVLRLTGMKVAMLLLLISASTCPLAAPALLTFAPTTPTTLTLQGNDIVTVSYVVTNQAARTTSWTMKPILGVVQLTGAAGECASPFVLGQNQSCALDLRLSATQMNDATKVGPIACESSSPLSCYQPSAANQLDVMVWIFADGFGP